MRNSKQRVAVAVAVSSFAECVFPNIPLFFCVSDVPFSVALHV